MHSEFYNVALDRIRYSIVWEDSRTFYTALDINTTDRLLIISSAGCNVLNALLKNPAAVTAIDLNPIQNKLLSLKKHIISNFDYDVYYDLLGFGGEKNVANQLQKLFDSLPASERNYWQVFFSNHPEGLLTAGRLEHYITGYYKTLTSFFQTHLTNLLCSTNIEEQYHYFLQNLDNSAFRDSFIDYFDDKNLSKGRDPLLLKYATETGGQAFYNRLKKQLRSTLVSNNFYFRFFFFGVHNLPFHILPPCYQRKNYNQLKEQIFKLEIVTGEAVDFLLSQKGSTVNKASLSNIFEYTSQQEFELVCTALSKNSRIKRTIVYWNLLNGQGENSKLKEKNICLEEVEPSEDSCFYFKNVFRLHIASLLS